MFTSNDLILALMWKMIEKRVQSHTHYAYIEHSFYLPLQKKNDLQRNQTTPHEGTESCSYLAIQTNFAPSKSINKLTYLLTPHNGNEPKPLNVF